MGIIISSCCGLSSTQLVDWKFVLDVYQHYLLRVDANCLGNVAKLRAELGNGIVWTDQTIHSSHKFFGGGACDPFCFDIVRRHSGMSESAIGVAPTVMQGGRESRHESQTNDKQHNKASHFVVVVSGEVEGKGCIPGRDRSLSFDIIAAATVFGSDIKYHSCVLTT